MDELPSMGGGRAAGLLAVMLVVVALALLPAVVGLGVVGVPAGWLVAGSGGLAVLIGVARLSTASWAALRRMQASQRALRASTSID